MLQRESKFNVKELVKRRGSCIQGPREVMELLHETSGLASGVRAVALKDGEINYLGSLGELGLRDLPIEKYMASVVNRLPDSNYQREGAIIDVMWLHGCDTQAIREMLNKFSLKASVLDSVLEGGKTWRVWETAEGKTAVASFYPLFCRIPKVRALASEGKTVPCSTEFFLLMLEKQLDVVKYMPRIMVKVPRKLIYSVDSSVILEKTRAVMPESVKSVEKFLKMLKLCG